MRARCGTEIETLCVKIRFALLFLQQLLRFSGRFLALMRPQRQLVQKLGQHVRLRDLCVAPPKLAMGCLRIALHL